MTEKEKKVGAKRFAEAWANRGDEKQETQVFWISLLREVFGVEAPEKIIQFEKRAIKVESGELRVGSEKWRVAHTPHSPLLTPHSTPHSTGFIDAYLSETAVLIEQKSSDVDLRKVQPSGLTPYQQARQYAAALPFSEHPRYIVTSNFREFLIYDQEKPTAEPESILLKNLPKEYYRLAFLVEEKSALLHREEEVSIKAGEIVGRLYDALLKQYANPDDKGTLHSLNVLCVRLVFCLYAEDAGIFGARNQFADYLRGFQPKDVRRALLDLFRILDTPVADRDRYEDPALLAFPYVNGGLFSVKSGEWRVESEEKENSSLPTPHSSLQIPQFTQEIVDILLHRASEDFDWSQISPTIFGAVFESTLNPETRRKGGMHYTSIENIHKVIDPLFLDDLRAELAEIKTLKQPKAIESQVAAFTRRLASLTFLDPACGSGNFLTETYLSLRRLENDALRLVYKWGGLDLGDTIQVQLNQFYGIEINDFAVTVAKTALWIAESQMMTETAEILGRTLDFLPLKSYTGIVEGNALKIDWKSILVGSGECEVESGEWRVKSEEKENSPLPTPHSSLNPPLLTPHSSLNPSLPTPHSPLAYDYIIGNPPFAGRRYRTAEQIEDVAQFFQYKDIDYVACWYYKAAQLMKGTNTRAAFVSTNSITQGEQVSALWKPLVRDFGVQIDFAHRTFKWNSEAVDKAAVHCVIVGFSCKGDNATTGGRRIPASANVRNNGDKADAGSVAPQKLIFTDGKPQAAANINGYLLDAPDIFVETRSKPLCDVPPMRNGNVPLDGDALKIEAEDIGQFSDCMQYVKRLIGGRELLHDEMRYVLWLVGASPKEIIDHPKIYARVKLCRDNRLAMKDKGTRALAETPTTFRDTLNPDYYIALPMVSSENRKYIPMAYFDGATIPTNQVQIIPSATLYHFGVLTSSVHMAWMRAVCGRLEMRYRYSKDIVYNNFPWPLGADASLRRGNGMGNIHCADAGSVASQSVAPLVASVSPKRSINPNNPKTPLTHSSLPTPHSSLITQTAQAILDIRARYPDASLADLYDPLTMPSDLRKAHRENDAAVLAAYGLSPDIPEPALVAHLMSLCQKQMANL